MKALVYAGDGAITFAEVAAPLPLEGHVVIDVLKAGVCGTDLGAVRTGRPKIAVGVVLGHEFVGRRASDGAIVVANPILWCGSCDACVQGRNHLCSQREVLGVHRPGAFAEQVIVPERNVVPVGDLAIEKAAVIEPIATALHAVNLAGAPIASAAVRGGRYRHVPSPCSQEPRCRARHRGGHKH